MSNDKDFECIIDAKDVESTRVRGPVFVQGAVKWRYPDWDKGGRVHNWKTYVSKKVRALWGSFTDEQKQALCEMCEEMADAEQWD